MAGALLTCAKACWALALGGVGGVGFQRGKTCPKRSKSNKILYNFWSFLKLVGFLKVQLVLPRDLRGLS